VSSVVLDASALLAFLRREPGGDNVQAFLNDAIISAVNLSEVMAKAAEFPDGFEAAKLALKGLPLQVAAFDEEQGVIAAGLRPVTRPLGLSLGDRCCIALGLIRELPVMTTDREWLKLPLGIPIQILR
jgi:PIN domain nuclease of toxin-antitoxin system